METKTTKLFAIAKNTKEFNRFRSLLDGSLKSVLDDEKISAALRENSAEAMSGQKHVTLRSDPCDIRKEHSIEIENIGKVLDLDKNVVNGYYTFNTVAIDEDGKRLHLVDTKVYSNREPQFVSQKELERYHTGALQGSEDPSDQEHAKIIQKLAEADDYINVSTVTFDNY
jgi:hypothetical protein